MEHGIELAGMTKAMERSGDILERSDIQEVIQAVDENQLDYVIIPSLETLSRNVIDTLKFQTILAERKVQLVSTTGVLYFGSDYFNFSKNVHLESSKQQDGRISRRKENSKRSKKR